MSMPNASAGREDSMGFREHWQVSTEYCAWLYYTPDKKYEMSMLVEGSQLIPPDDQHERGCSLPAFVEDHRYPKNSLKYVYFLHNHPAVPTNISRKDLSALSQIKRIHGKHAETKDGQVPIGIVAFFSTSNTPSPTTCDGFFEYTLGSTQVLKWTSDGNGHWRSEMAGTVTWLSETEFDFEPEKK
jgi:hypothetical protein